MLERGICLFVKYRFLSYILDVVFETRWKKRNWVICQMDSSKEIPNEEVDTHSYKQKRDPLFSVPLNFSTSVRSWIDKPRDLGLLFSHRNITLWVSFLFLKKKKWPQH